jgi:hypothetical protein
VRRRLINSALRRRFDELCAVRIRAIVPEQYGSMAVFVAATRERILSAQRADSAASRLPRWNAPRGWINAEDSNCLASLRALCLGEKIDAHIDTGADVLASLPFIETLERCRQQPQERFRLLTERYRYALNITVASEEAIREYLLMRLMVQDRARILKRSAQSIESDDLLLKLNLLALHAALVPDLRYLDALNYYYELLPAEWNPRLGQHAWLLVSYLALYAYALSAHFKEERECV